MERLIVRLVADQGTVSDLGDLLWLLHSTLNMHHMKSILLLTLYKQLFKITACQTILYANDLKFATMFCFLISNSVKCYTIKCWQMVPKLRLYNQLLSRPSNAEYISVDK